MTVRELRRAAEMLRVLAIAEHARIIGDTDTVERILDGVDPRELDDLAAKCDFDAGVRALGRRLFPSSTNTRREAGHRGSSRTPW